MGYRVGRICYETKQEAVDVVVSQVLPVIAADGSLRHPVKQGDNWQYAGQPVNLSLPECDPHEYFKAGLEVSQIVIVILATIYGFRLIKKFIERMPDREGE